MSVSSASVCPDLIVLHPGSGNLNVFAFRVGIRAKSLLWREKLRCAANLDVASELQGVLTRHPMHPKTTTALIADPAHGGLFTVAGPSGVARDATWVGRQLELALSFSPTELHWRTRAKAGRVEVFWLPKVWARTQIDMLARLGLCLNEIYPRAALWREEAEKTLPQQSCVFLENDALHSFEGGLSVRSSPLPAQPAAAANAQQLEKLAMGNSAASSTKSVSVPPDDVLGQRLLGLWLDGSEAIHLETARWSVWRPALSFAAACAFVAVVAAIVLSTLNARMEKTLDELTREQRKLATVEQKFADMERSIRSDRKYVAAAKQLDASPLPLEMLNQLSAALPDKYWIQHLQFKDGALELSGRGGSNDDVIRSFGKKGIEALASVMETAPGTSDKTSSDGFRVKVALATRQTVGPSK